MSANHKNVMLGKGATLYIGPGKYISARRGGTDVVIRGNGKVIAFDTWEDLIEAIDTDKSSYYKEDNYE